MCVCVCMCDAHDVATWLEEDVCGSGTEDSVKRGQFLRVFLQSILDYSQ